jgi:hypothetical protein
LTVVDITFSPPDSGHGRWLTIRDNGHGMNEAQLDEAMTLGSDAEYEDNTHCAMRRGGPFLRGPPAIDRIDHQPDEFGAKLRQFKVLNQLIKSEMEPY